LLEGEDGGGGGCHGVETKKGVGPQAAGVQTRKTKKGKKSCMVRPEQKGASAMPTQRLPLTLPETGGGKKKKNKNRAARRDLEGCKRQGPRKDQIEINGRNFSPG